MKSTKKYTHRGEILRKVAEKHDLSIIKIAKKAGYSRGSYYNHISQSDLSFEIMQQYGKAMGYNFADDFPEMKDYVMEDPESTYIYATTFEEAVQQRDHWRNKYYSLLEKIAIRNLKL
ncbi:MAG TPA: helix-turn-helix transcriptional regulator [Chitinophagaceae bacterium]|nr:helix-turn-helix transcriptional regulator [Chitinophagaceae bacterium]